MVSIKELLCSNKITEDLPNEYRKGTSFLTKVFTFLKEILDNDNSNLYERMYWDFPNPLVTFKKRFCFGSQSKNDNGIYNSKRGFWYQKEKLHCMLLGIKEGND